MNPGVSIWEAITGILTIVQFIGFIIVFCIVKFNDLAHLEKKMDKLAESQDAMQAEINGVSKNVSYLMGVNKGKELKTRKK